ARRTRSVTILVPPKATTEMTRSTEARAAPRPADLDVQDWAAYDLIIDARSPREFSDDHIPGALNLPVVVDDEYAAVGTLHRTDTHAAYLLGVQQALRNIADDIAEHIAPLPRHARILVYCFRGGKRSELWSSALRIIGFKVDVLRGGWRNYRRWVREGLDTLPRNFRFKLVAGPTGVGKTRFLAALRTLGEQVIDLEGIAHHRGSVLGEVPGEPQPTQKQFDSDLLAQLRLLDPDRPVWLESESKRIGRVQLPVSLFEAMQTSPVVLLGAPMASRVQLWHDEYPNLAADPKRVVSLLGALADTKMLVGNKEFAAWEQLAASGDTRELFARVMEHYYDPLYGRSLARDFHHFEQAVRIELDDLSMDGMIAAAKRVCAAA
ncbi:MAG TPA: tRNA 2-selenouridine(34) synthase MnmH, partial [Rhizobacter sp.]|nr:tRNA 2-selenouridine(34) synthase MnmH [Rhizobacter sp.]